MYYIYLISNIINDKVYIGQTHNIDKRMYEHKRDNKSIISKAINKYGWQKFNLHIICECKTKEESNDMEIYYINKFNSLSPYGYNISPGGTGGGVYDMSGRNNPMYGVAPWNKGKKLSGVIIQNMIEGHRYISGEKSPNAKPIILIHPNGKEEKFGCVIDASRKYNLDHSTLSKIAKEKVKHCKGFKCKYV